MVKQDLNLRVKIDKDQMFETYLEGSNYPFPDFIHTQSHQKSIQYILHKNWFVVLVLPNSDRYRIHPEVQLL